MFSVLVIIVFINVLVGMRRGIVLVIREWDLSFSFVVEGWVILRFLFYFLEFLFRRVFFLFLVVLRF